MAEENKNVQRWNQKVFRVIVMAISFGQLILLSTRSLRYGRSLRSRVSRDAVSVDGDGRPEDRSATTVVKDRAFRW